ncbi:MAG: hypothetical protein R3237_02925 [Nitrosopumilaceae archaeon]|nr:hypothetical protein [Nitrosopumilaceae archaeon]
MISFFISNNSSPIYPKNKAKQLVCKKKLHQTILITFPKDDFCMTENVQEKDEEERPEWAWLMKRMTRES